MVIEGQLRLPVGYAERLDAGEVVMSVGRASGGGSKSRDGAARDLAGAVQQFANQTGVDFSPLLPSHDAMVQLLKDAENKTSKGADGKPIHHRFVVIDHSATHQFVAILASGSGAKTAEDDSLPFVKFVSENYRRFNVCAFNCKRLDRWVRGNWAIAPLMQVLEGNDGLIADEEGCSRLDDGRSTSVFVRGSSAKKTAKDIPLQTRREQKNRTGHVMVGGRVAYHAASPLPPGLGECWLKGSGTSPTERIAYIDTNACRPPDESVAYGLSEVRYPTGHPQEGERVDQVENVRFALRQLGKPGMTKRQIVDELVTRQYSTSMFRAQNGVGASIGRGSDSARLQAILDNLDFYEFGVLRRGVGAGVDVIEITDCFPPDGPWATPADFSRIRSYMKESDASTAQDTKLTFSGLRVTLNGNAVVMLTGRTQTVQQMSGSARPYWFALVKGYPRKLRTAPGNQVLDPDAFAESIVLGIMNADGVDLEAFDPERFGTPNDAKLTQLRAEQSMLRAEVAARTKEMQELEARLLGTNADGTGLLQGPLFERAQARYNEIASTALPDLQESLRQVDIDVSDRMERLPRVAPAEMLLHLVASLRDHECLQYRGQWLSSMRNLRFESGTHAEGDLKIQRLSWQGDLVLGGPEGQAMIPFSGTYDFSRGLQKRRRTLPRAEQLVVQLLEGKAIDWGDEKHPAVIQKQVASILDVSERHMILNGCVDPRVLRVATFILTNREMPDADAAAKLDVEEALVARVRAVHLGPDSEREWVRSPSYLHVAFYAAAAADNGRAQVAAIKALVPNSSRQVLYTTAHSLRQSSPRWGTERKRGYVLAPCECGSTNATLMSIPEPVGAVCLDCWFDEARIEWPRGNYEEYCMSGVVR